MKKTRLPFRNQYPQIFRYAKFHAKIKLLTFTTKNALSGYFQAGIQKKPLS